MIPLFPNAARPGRRTVLALGALVPLSACGLLFESADDRYGAADSAEWRSPSGAYVARISRDQGTSLARPVIVDAATGAVVYTATRNLSLRSRLTIAWQPGDVLRVESSDIGTWTVARTNGTWTETWAGPSTTPTATPS